MYKPKLRRLLSIILAVVITLSLPIAAAEVPNPQAGAEESAGFIQGEYIIQYNDGIIGLFSMQTEFSPSPTEVLMSYGAEIESLSSNGLALVTTDQPMTEAEEASFIRELESSPRVKHVEKNREIKAFFDTTPTPHNDTLAGEQWGPASVRAFSAWQLLPSSSDVTVRVAVIDTGVDATHPDLIGRVISGYNTMDYNSKGQRYSSADTTDDNGHGTHVSGIIAAICNNVRGIQGVTGMANVEILPIKALNDNGNGTTYNLVNALYYAADNGADIINMSLGSNYPSDLEREAIFYAQNRNCLVIAAAGNDSMNVSTTYPASYANVMAVGSIDRDDGRSYFSNYGQTLDISAPGGNIISTIPAEIAIQSRAAGDTVYGNDTDGYYAAWSGTSMAAPHVAGAAALYKAVNPSALNSDISKHLTDTARDVGPIGFDIETGWGVVDAAATLGSESVKTTLLIVSPVRESELYETVNFRVQINPNMGIETVDLYLDDTDGQPIATIACAGGLSYFDAQFNTRDVSDGTYDLIAVARGSVGEDVGQTQIPVKILNYITDGFTLNVLDPNSTGADSAEILVFGKGGDGSYTRLQSAQTSVLGYSRIKGLGSYDKYLILGGYCEGCRRMG